MFRGSSRLRRRSVIATDIDLVEAENLSPELRIALAWTPKSLRARLATAFALDQRLGRIVAQANEPLLAQMRLAWWRDKLAKPCENRPTGDLVLDAIGTHWSGVERELAHLVDGWEVMLGEPPMMRGAAKSFANARSRAFASLAGPEGSNNWQRVHAAATRWAMADAASHISDSEERCTFIEVGLGRASNIGFMPRELRGLAVLEALALRSLRAGGAPLMQGRGAALIALRVGIFGR